MYTTMKVVLDSQSYIWCKTPVLDSLLTLGALASGRRASKVQGHGVGGITRFAVLDARCRMDARLSLSDNIALDHSHSRALSLAGRLEYVCWFVPWLDGGNSVVHKNVRHTYIHLLVGIWPLPSFGLTSDFVFLYCTLGVV
jgi:hypothetical protein